MANKQYSIYYLLDPVTGRVRYIGCSCRPSARFAETHLKAKGGSHRALWIKQLLVAGLSPVFSLKCILQSEEEMFRVEVALIAKLREKGEPLTNMTAGGEGLIDPSPEIRAKRSAAMVGNTRFVGRKHSNETKQQIAESRKRFNVEHPESVAQIAAKQLGNKRGELMSAEVRQAKSELMRGNTNAVGYRHTDVWKKEQGVRRLGNKSRTGQTNSEESNLRRSVNGKLAAAKRKEDGFVRSKEHNAKLAEAIKAAWAKRKSDALLFSERDSFDSPSDELVYEEMLTS